MGKCTKADAFAIMDAFYENGGIFIDTYVVGARREKKNLTLPVPTITSPSNQRNGLVSG
jgi:hypothetical protein